MNIEEYVEQRGIRIYTGLTEQIRQTLQLRIDNYRRVLARYMEQSPTIPRLGCLTSSTITAQGCITGIQFNEEELITRIPPPTGNIMFIGCNFGELSNPAYVQKQKPQKSTVKGRRPKLKTRPKRIMKGTGKYFGSQMTFDIMNVENGHIYKIKLFRTGVFQVPHVRSPDMGDLCGPIITLLEYLKPIFGPTITVTDFKAVMRNYKSELTDPNHYVDLQQMNSVLRQLKNDDRFTEPDAEELHSQALGIAEITYNVDRHASLLVKFNRPTTADPTKQTTIKLIKSGKINFDGGSNRLEIEELYLIISMIYATKSAEVIVDQRCISTIADQPTEAPADDQISLYDYQISIAENPALFHDVKLENATANLIMDIISNQQQLV